MKHYQVLFVFAVCALLSIPSLINAQAVVCPEGYICTPINATVNVTTSVPAVYSPSGGPTSPAANPTSGTTPASPVVNIAIPAVPVNPNTVYVNAQVCSGTRLLVGSSGPQVVAVQTALLEKGIDIPAISAKVAAKGYFGAQTKAAVVKYQASNGLKVTGEVDAQTLTVLTPSVCSTPSTPSTPSKSEVSLLMPFDFGNNVISRDKIHTIKWTDSLSVPQCPVGAYCSSPAPRTYDIKLTQHNPPRCDGTICVQIDAVSQPISIATNVSGTSYDWKVNVPNGQYQLTVCRVGSTACDTTDHPFTLTSGPVN